MNDQEFLTAFENTMLPMEQWTHRAHVRIAYLYASRHDLQTAIDTMRKRIKAYNQATDTPEAIDQGYHETMTVAFMRLIHAAILQSGPYESSVEFCNAQPDLMTKLVLKTFYSSERIMTWEAKRNFVEPDLEQLPPTP